MEPPAASTHGAALVTHTGRHVGAMFCAHVVEKVVLGVSGVVLMRLLSPADVGVVGFGLVLVGLLSAVGTFGLEAAAVHLRVSDEIRMLSSAWTLRLVVGLACFFIAVLAAEPMTYLFTNAGIPRQALGRVIRWLAVVLLIDAMVFYPRVMLQRQLRFGPLAVAQGLSAVCYAICAVALAFWGYAYWSLVYALIISQVCFMCALWAVGPRRWPILQWEPGTMRVLFTYGKHISSASILWAVATKTGEFVVSRWFGAAALGSYLTAGLWSRWADLNVTHVVTRVLFPMYALMRDETERLRHSLERTLFCVYALILPIMGGLVVFVSDITRVLLGPQWETLSHPVRILSIAGVVAPCIHLYGQAFLAVGRPELVRNYTGLYLLLFAGFFYPAARIGGFTGLCWAAVAADVGVLVAASRMGRAALGMDPSRLVRALAASVGSCGVAMGTAMFLRAWHPVSNLFTLTWQVISFLGVFAGALNTFTGGRLVRELQHLIPILSSPLASRPLA